VSTPSAAEALAAVYPEIIKRLEKAGVESARLDARLLLGEVLGLTPTQVIAAGDRQLSGPERMTLDALVRRREGREPMARILGRQEFWSLTFAVSPDTLIPRPDSETLVEAALARLKPLGGRLRLLDLGTGTGCLLLSLLTELPEAEGVGIDLSPGAVATAAANARSLGLDGRCRFQLGDWTAAAGPFDGVVCNPPYIPDGEIAGLAPEVARYEPRLALAGGQDGYTAYRCIAEALPKLLAHSGYAFFEIGQGGASPVAAILQENGLEVIEIKSDLAGIERCLIARLAAIPGRPTRD
jgi:release factor glutamine methyltransferase